MTNPSSIVAHDRVFTVKAYRGDASVLLAMSLPEAACDGLAGFAIARAPAGTKPVYAKNRLGFDASKGEYATKDPQQQLADGKIQRAVSTDARGTTVPELQPGFYARLHVFARLRRSLW